MAGPVAFFRPIETMKLKDILSARKRASTQGAAPIEITYVQTDTQAVCPVPDWFDQTLDEDTIRFGGRF